MFLPLLTLFLAGHTAAYSTGLSSVAGICSLLNIFPPEYPTQLGRPAGEVTEDALVLDISSLEEGNGQVENSHIN